MTMPGEPFVDFQLDWRRRSPVPNAILMGCTKYYRLTPEGKTRLAANPSRLGTNSARYRRILNPVTEQQR